MLSTLARVDGVCSLLAVKHYFTHVWTPRLGELVNVLPDFRPDHQGSLLQPDYATVIGHINAAYETTIKSRCLFDERTLMTNMTEDGDICECSCVL